MIAQTILVMVPAALWISSIHVDYPNRLGLICVAILLGKKYPNLRILFCSSSLNREDTCGAIVIIFIFRNMGKFSPKLAKKFGEWFEFFPGRLTICQYEWNVVLIELLR